MGDRKLEMRAKAGSEQSRLIKFSLPFSQRVQRYRNKGVESFPPESRILKGGQH